MSIDFDFWSYQIDWIIWWGGRKRGNDKREVFFIISWISCNCYVFFIFFISISILILSWSFFWHIRPFFAHIRMIIDTFFLILGASVQFAVKRFTIVHLRMRFWNAHCQLINRKRERKKNQCWEKGKISLMIALHSQSKCFKWRID